MYFVSSRYLWHRTHARVSGHVRSQTCAEIRSFFLVTGILLYPLWSLGRHTGLERASIHMWGRMSPFYEIDHLRKSSQVHPWTISRSFLLSTRRKIGVVAASVINARLYWWICAMETPLYRKKGTNPPLLDFETCEFFLFVVTRNSTVFDECILHYVYRYIIT